MKETQQTRENIGYIVSYTCWIRYNALLTLDVAQHRPPPSLPPTECISLTASRTWWCASIFLFFPFALNLRFIELLKCVSVKWIILLNNCGVILYRHTHTHTHTPAMLTSVCVPSDISCRSANSSMLRWSLHTELMFRKKHSSKSDFSLKASHIALSSSRHSGWPYIDWPCFVNARAVPWLAF